MIDLVQNKRKHTIKKHAFPVEFCNKKNAAHHALGFQKSGRREKSLSLIELLKAGQPG